jgi:hypothetical protein
MTPEQFKETLRSKFGFGQETATEVSEEVLTLLSVYTER